MLHLMETCVAYICGGQYAMNVTHWELESAETNLWLLAKRHLAAWESPVAGDDMMNKICGIMSEQAAISSITCRVIRPSPGTKAIKVFPLADYPGTFGMNDIYSQQVACNMKEITASGPDKTGRVFFPGIDEASLLNGRWTTDFITVFNALASLWMTGIDSTDGNWTPAVYTRSDHTWESVTNVMLAKNPGTIRRRLSPI